jgi:two-component system, OmpR family, phosphate regulon sensor histidine kinase PhoR
MALRKTPRGQSMMIAGIALFFYAVGCGLVCYFTPVDQFYWLAAFGMVLFLVIYFVVHRTFLSYVEKRLNPIFKTIQNVTLSQRKIRKSIDSGNFSEELDEEVKLWADNQTDEIRQLREMEKYRKDFLGNVSHELKTPIFNIQGYILTLLDGGIDDPKINTMYLQRAEKSVNRMISIVDDLVSISRLESGEFKLKLEDFNIVKLVEDVFESHEMLAKKFKVKLEFDSNYNKPIKVNADKKRMTEVLNNLIVNSIKYGKENGKTVVGFIDTGDTILVDITDNGIGIEEEDLPRIFERFYRVDKSRSRDSGGTGLGLAIVKHIIQAHDQAINVRSRAGKGTSFVFSLNKG